MKIAPAYVDHNASTPPSSEVIEVMLPWLRDWHANPHSDHFHGRRAQAAIEIARTAVAELVGADPEEVIFTSGATESANIALQGYLRDHGRSGRLLHSSIEHPCVREIGRALAPIGVSTQIVPVDRSGLVHAESLQKCLRSKKTARTLVSLIHASNEIGTVQPIAELAEIARESDAIVHIDASQSAAWLPINDLAQQVDMVTVSSHKLGGPAGIAALFVSSGVERELSPITYGGGQEAGLRPGTIPTFLAVGFGAACRIVQRDRSQKCAAAATAVNAFISRLLALGVTLETLGHPTARLPGLCSLRFPGVLADDLLCRLNPVLSASSSSACSSGSIKASTVLRALGLSETEAREVVRFGFGAAFDASTAQSLADAVAAQIIPIEIDSSAACP